MTSETRPGADAERRHLVALARASTATLAGAVVSTASSFGLVLLVTRSVDPDAAGTFFAATAIFVVALAAAGLGTDAGLARFVLRQEAGSARALVRTAAVPVLVVSVLLSVAMAVFLASSRPLVWALPLAATADLCLATVRAHNRFRATVVIDRLLRPGLQLLLVAVVLLLGLPDAAMAIAWGSAYVVAAAVSVRTLSRLLHRPPGEDAPRPDREQKAFWRFTWPRAVARVAQVIVQKGDIVVVAWLTSPADAAVYTVATRFVVFGQLANQAISSVVQPRFTLILASEKGAERAVLSRVFGVTTSWSILLAWPIYLAAAAGPASYLGWFGDFYGSAEAHATVLVMALGMLVAVASGPVDTLLLMAGRSGWSLANTLTALVLDLGLCVVLVPRMGIAGAAVAWIVAVVVRCALAMAQLHLELGLRLDPRGLLLACALPVLCVATPVGLLGLAVDLSPLGWLGASLAAVAGYAAVLWRMRVRLAIDVFLEAVGPRRQPGLVSA